MPERKTAALLVNPVAGMGGSVGLRGTDGDAYEKAIAMGARPVSPSRAVDFLGRMDADVAFVTAPGAMGADHFANAGLEYRIVGDAPDRTTAEDTIKAARLMMDMGADIIVFAGGDGTARDMVLAVHTDIPVIGIPAGVKIFSPAFACSARAAAAMLKAFVEGAPVREEDVLDIDEEAFRENRLSAKLFGSLLVPDVREFLQGGKKASTTGGSARRNKEALAKALASMMLDDVLYLVGPGTTMNALMESMGLEGTLLGVDAVCNSALVESDVNEKDMLRLFGQFPRRSVIVTPLGGNGFILGRGSKQFTPEVLSHIGRENIIVAGERNKISPLECLRVDTGDEAMDKRFCGPVRIVVDRDEHMLLEVRD